MKIRIAKNSGFCFGVKRAIKMAEDASKKYNEIVTLGSIIHNPQMVKKLEQQGIHKVNSLSEIKGRPTIIRSHGVEKNTFNKLLEQNIEIVDTTCPYVSKTQEYTQLLGKAGYQVIILGDKNHPEVIALQSYSDGNTIVVKDASELPDKKFDKVGVISQTTRNIEDLQNLTRELLPRCRELRIMNTICNATSIRQKATLELAKESDLMIVIGGRNSSNTKMLAKISGKYIKTHHIEVAEEIDKKWFKNVENIGITAGASTPDWIIVEVYNKIIEYLGNHEKKISKIEDIPGLRSKDER
ncbi:MAG: 4-hydroxy-3-methylbut-2-enyl diphosphate reductase [Candidatus Cloacimonadota bacterium]|nr:MAG: 4-hydroxy-3-methylbut-2-enyl diphosphate reductase [Candidatus Cloacimonadota bacterium]